MPATMPPLMRPAAASSGITADALPAPRRRHVPFAPSRVLEGVQKALWCCLLSMASTFQAIVHQGRCCSFQMQLNQPGAV